MIIQNESTNNLLTLPYITLKYQQTYKASAENDNVYLDEQPLFDDHSYCCGERGEYSTREKMCQRR